MYIEINEVRDFIILERIRFKIHYTETVSERDVNIQMLNGCSTLLSEDINISA